MCNAFKFLIYLYICCSYFFIRLHAQEEYLKDCSEGLDCPKFSVCSRVIDSFKCVCRTGFYHNPKWYPGLFDKTEYCATEHKKWTFYGTRSARGDHLAEGILLFLFAVIVVTTLIYFLVIIHPIQRTKAVYRSIQLRRKRMHRMEEFNEIDMAFPHVHTDSIENIESNK